MYLRTIVMKGFKSFPDRTTLEFAPGVSVIVGPNGSGKSNVSDAVLWALGEQRPLSVRGQTMQDVIFSGGHGLPSRNAAEVEVVLDNSDGALGGEFAELSIKRRLERSGEGEYRLNGARCRLVDVLEVLSDTGLGKEMHSIVSQGRVEAVIHSRPADRRLLIEEAAGLGKHRKRRRRAELKLSRTADNLSRALDVEREARSRLRPLKRQAEAAELHERLERQSVEARLALARDSARGARSELARAEEEAARARSTRAEIDRRLEAVATRRESAERGLEASSRAREALSERLFAATTGADRVDLRLERARETASAAGTAAARARSGLERLEGTDRTITGERPAAEPGPGSAERIGALESEIGALDAARDERIETEVASLEAERREARERCEALRRSLDDLRGQLADAESAVDSARTARREAAAALEAARSEHARAAAELEAAEQLARSTPPAPGDSEPLAEGLRVDPGYERAVAAVLGPLLGAGLAPDLRQASDLLDRGRDDGGIVLVETVPSDGRSEQASPPFPGAERLLDHVHPLAAATATVERLLARTWVVDSLEQVPEGFSDVAVTRAGRALVGRTAELRQAPTGGHERTLGHRARRDELVAIAGRAAAGVADAEAADAGAGASVGAAEAARDGAEATLSGSTRELREAEGRLHDVEAAIERRRAGAEDDRSALRRAELRAELGAERAMAERTERQERERSVRADRLRCSIERQEAVRRDAVRAARTLAATLDAIAAHRESVRRALTEDEAATARSGTELRACAREEAEAQAELRTAGEEVTGAEVTAQRARDAAEEAAGQVARLAERIGLDAEAGAERALAADERSELEARVDRLARRREQLGPVNPLAKSEYDAAVDHVEDLESQREDLEAALAELERVIRDTDRRIRESFERTFEATARNFEEVVGHLFPGGRGRLRLVSQEGPRSVIAGEGESEREAEDADAAESADAGGEFPGETEAAVPGEDDPGVEVEVTPAGKSTRRLSLLSGGEKSLVALAFLFAVFLARPCPFYVLDEVEAALDDLNIDRFLELVRRCSDRAQFIVVTHQKRTMDAADRLYGISMGSDGASKVVSRRLAPAPVAEPDERLGAEPGEWPAAATDAA